MSGEFSALPPELHTGAPEPDDSSQITLTFYNALAKSMEVVFVDQNNIVR